MVQFCIWSSSRQNVTSDDWSLLSNKCCAVLESNKKLEVSLMAERRNRDNEARMDELGTDPGQVGSDSAGQSGDAQGLSDIEEANEESVEELADTDQAFEADVVQGVEDAGDHPEKKYAPHKNQNTGVRKTSRPKK